MNQGFTGGKADYYMLDGAHHVHRIDYAAHVKSIYKHIDACLVAHTKITKETSVNTIFLGYDEASLPTWRKEKPAHALVFSTRVMHAGTGGDKQYYASSYEDAQKIHDAVVKVLKTRNPQEPEPVAYTLKQRRAMMDKPPGKKRPDIMNVAES